MAESNNCPKGCWIAGIVLGIIAFFVLKGPMHWGLIGALIGGIVIALICAYVLKYFFCTASDATQSSSSAAAPMASSTASSSATASSVEPAKAMADTSASDSAAEAAPAAKAEAAAPAAATTSSEPLIKPSKPLKGEEELAAAKGDWKYEAAPAASVPAEPKAKKAAAPKAEKAPAKAKAEKAPAKAKAEKAPAKAKAPAKSKAPAKEAEAPVVDDAAVEAAGAGKKPRGLKEPRKGQADDLKLIEGVGPVLEKLCNDLGIYHYDQIAKWGPDEVAFMNQNMPRFRGRVSRDKWVAQARLIGELGIEEFLERAKTNNY